MASKKELKQRAKDAERRADELFRSAAERASELARIDTYLMNLQLPGPNMRDWAYQMRDALLHIAEMRGLPTVPRAVMTAPDAVSYTHLTLPTILRV